MAPGDTKQVLFFLFSTIYCGFLTTPYSPYVVHMIKKKTYLDKHNKFDGSILLCQDPKHFLGLFSWIKK